MISFIDIPMAESTTQSISQDLTTQTTSLAQLLRSSRFNTEMQQIQKWIEIVRNLSMIQALDQTSSDLKLQQLISSTRSGEVKTVLQGVQIVRKAVREV